uniref:Neuropeptide-like 4 n=1 Tax=Coptotermes formosanus TaxID=36987 RepID=R4V0Q7_COPFO|nr:hypothetical protein [Coptotermes formosanus]
MKFAVAFVLFAALVAAVSGAAFPGPRPYPAGPAPREALAGSETVHYPYAYYPAYSSYIFWP